MSFDRNAELNISDLKDPFRVVLLDVTAAERVMSFEDLMERAGRMLRRLERYDGFAVERTS